MIPRPPRTRGHHTVEQLRSEGGTGPLPWGEAPTTGDWQQVRQLLTEPERGARPRRPTGSRVISCDVYLGASALDFVCTRSTAP